MYGMELSRKRNPGTLLNSLDLWWMEGLHPLQFMPFCKHTCHEMISRIKILDLGGLLTQDLETLLWQLGNLWFFAAKVVKGNSAYRKETKTRRCCYVLFGSFLFPSFLFQNESFHSNSSISKVPLEKKNICLTKTDTFNYNWISLCGLKASFLLHKKPSLEEVFATFDINSFKVRSDCDGGGGNFQGWCSCPRVRSKHTCFFDISYHFLNKRHFSAIFGFGWAHINIYTSLCQTFWGIYLLSRNRRY